MKKFSATMQQHFSFLVISIVGLTSLTTPLLGKTPEQKIKEAIDQVADALKSGVDQLEDDFEAIQEYFDHYPWKGLIEDKVQSGPATLKDLRLNDHKRAIVVHPGQRIEGEVKCSLKGEQLSPHELYRVVIGIKGQGAQTTICNYLGAVARDTLEKFVLTAPREPGIYQIRFRVVEKFLESDALAAWKDAEGNEPDGSATIGLIFVQP